MLNLKIRLPNSVERQLSREGFGLKLNSTNVSLFTKKARETLTNYVRGDSKTDLVFAPEFTNEERSVIHKWVLLNSILRGHTHLKKLTNQIFWLKFSKN